MVAVCSPMVVFCQDITGLWKGTMFNDSTQQSLQYEIVITKKKGKYTGFSHTWFVVNGKKYYGIRKIDVRIAKDGKIVMQDSKLVEENYPMLPTKDIQQLNVLDLAKLGDEASLDGLFVTNRTKQRRELSGSIHIKKVNPSSESDLVQYLEKNSGDNSFTVAK
jgi:hypothetical protein